MNPPGALSLSSLETIHSTVMVHKHTRGEVWNKARMKADGAVRRPFSPGSELLQSDR